MKDLKCVFDFQIRICFDTEKTWPTSTRIRRWTYSQISLMSCVKASLIVYVYASTHAWHVMPKVSTQVYMLDCKIWKLFGPRGKEGKRTKCDQFFCPTSDFFDFLQSLFLLSYLYQWRGFFWQNLRRNRPMWPQFVYIAVSLDWKINI